MHFHETVTVTPLYNIIQSRTIHSRDNIQLLVMFRNVAIVCYIKYNIICTELGNVSNYLERRLKTQMLTYFNKLNKLSNL